MPTPGPLELVIILVIALIILGPGKLPDVGASLGKSIREFRKASSDIQESVTVQVDTSPLPAQAPVTSGTQAAPATSSPAAPATSTPSASEAQARIAELERQLAATRASAEAETPVTVGAAPSDTNNEATS